MSKTTNLSLKEKNELLTDKMEDAVCCFLPDGKITYANEGYFLKIAKTKDKEKINKFVLHVLDQYRNQFSVKLKKISWKKHSFTLEQEIIKRNNNKCIIEWLVKGIFNNRHSIIEFCAVGRDITTSKKGIKQLVADVENRFRTLFDSANDTILIMDRDQFVDFNKKSLEMYGCTRQQFLSRPPSSFWPELQPDGRKTKDIAVERIVAAMRGETRSFELRHKRFDGSLIDTEVSLNFVEYLRKKYLMAIIRDITERKHAEDIIKQLAYHDTLTGLPNRRLFIDRLETALALAKRNEHKIALIMFDIDYFKEVNDSYGHHVGDILLREVADRLCFTLRKSDTIGRMGGDEFMIIISYESINQESLAIIAGKIIKSFNEPIKCENKKIKVTPSIGVAIYPEHGENVNTLMKCADMAMYSAKKLGRNQYHVYDGIEYASPHVSRSWMRKKSV